MSGERELSADAISGDANAVLLVIAHPDDEILCGAGTLALCAARGRAVHVVCATRGEYGPIADAALATSETLGSVRERELRDSCAVLGVRSLRFLDLPDAGVDWAAEEQGSVRALVRAICELRPSVLIAFGEDGVYGHGDHVAVHELTVAARRLAAAEPHGSDHVPRLFFPIWSADFVDEFLAALHVENPSAHLWHIARDHFTAQRASITASVDVTSTLDRKLRALRCHRTQLESDNALLLAHGAIAQRYLGVEHFQCADGLPGSPLD